MPKCIILIGPPCSGKSSWVEDNPQQYHVVVSCDNIRDTIGGKKYKHTRQNENKVWEVFYKTLDIACRCGVNVIIDNTNTKRMYINKIKERLPDYEFEYVWFDQPFWKLRMRNWLRYLRTGKWIPMQILRNMHNNYLNLKECFEDQKFST